MVAHGERMEQLWSESGNEQQRGPLFDARVQLSDSFNRVNSLSQLPDGIEKQGESTISDLESFSSKNNPYTLEDGKQNSYSTKALLSGVNAIHIAVQEKPRTKNDQVDDTIYEYILNENGTVVRTDELDAKATTPSVSPKEIELVGDAAHAIIKSMASGIAQVANVVAMNEIARNVEKSRRKERRARRIGWTAGILITTTGLVAGGYFGWKGFIDGPGKEDDARRATYDSEAHTIDGEGIQLDNQKLTIIDDETFDQIPSFRGGDSLKSPRTVDLGEDGCADISVDNLDGKTIRVGVSEFNPLGSYAVVAYESNNDLNVCTTEDFDSTKIPDAKIALQIVDPNER